LSKTQSVSFVREASRVIRARVIGGILGSSLAFSAAGLCQTSAGGTDNSDVRIVSSFVPAGEPVPRECRDEARLFAESLIRYPRPASWHWVLLCDEAGWRQFLRLSGRSEGEAIYASTDLEACTTYLRGAKLFNLSNFGADADEVVAHELAHIRLDSQDEAAAQDLARVWQRYFRKGDSGTNRARNPGD
jgi:hypothetical protein